MLVNSILHGPYVRRMIIEPGDLDRDVLIAESFYELTNEKLTKKETMNNFARKKHIPEKIACNLTFLNNLQPEWKRYVTIDHQTKDLHTIDYTQLYDFLKFSQAECFTQINHHRLPTCKNHNTTLWELSSFRTISINITSPSSSLVQMSSVLDVGGTNPSDSKNELNLRTFSVMNVMDGSGGVGGLTWIFSGLSSSSLFSFSQSS
ncbi:hypothetical protein Tco_0965663 [Tanacetum coccineum]